MFSNIFTAKAITIYSDELVDKMIDYIHNNSTVYTIVSSFLVETRKKVREMDELCLFLLNLHGKFRGKEFFRAYMGSGENHFSLGFNR